MTKTKTHAPCPKCGAGMVTKQEDVPYRSLPGAMLVDVEVSRCSACDEYVIAVPTIDRLNELLAKLLIDDKRRLVGTEVKFLRKCLGYSSTDLAKIMGTTSATVSRWENSARPISRHADRLLRALVIIDKKVNDYSIAKFADLAAEGAPKKAGPRFRFTQVPSTKKWKPAEVRV